ncbi:MAG: pilus assembly protein PilM [Parcubacteria group bacterium]|nr:pilus assembly protein PilM [Parcubacteria group bacterium]
MSFFGPKKVLGLDIGTSSIKIVELALGKQPQITNYGVIENANHLTQPSKSLQSSAHAMGPENISDLLKQLLTKTGIRGGEVYATYPIFSSFATLLEFPELSPEEVERTISYSFRQYVPLTPQETAYEWIEAGEKRISQPGDVGGGGTIKKLFFLTAISKKIVANYTVAIEKAGLHLKSIESETLSVLRILRAASSLEEKTIAVLDIGAYATNIIVIRNGYVVVNRGLDSGGGDITRSIARGLGVDGSHAEEVKKTQGLTYSVEQAAVHQLVYFALDSILEEAKRVFEMYKSKFDEPISEVVLVGGSSLLRGIDGYFSEKVGIKAISFTSLYYFNVKPEERSAVEVAFPQLVVATGAALKAKE